MTRDEYLQILRDNLTTMTDDEKDDVIRYYLEYFIDSGDEQAAMEELGAPEKLAARLCSGNGAQNSENYSTENYTSTQNTANVYGGYTDGSSSGQWGNNSQNSGNGNYNSNYSYSDSTANAGYGYSENTGNANYSHSDSTGAYDYSWEEENTKKKKSPGKIIALACTAPIWAPLAFAGLAILLSLLLVVVVFVIAVFVVFAACVIAGIASVVAGFVAFGKSLADGLIVLGGGLFMLGAGILAFFLGTYIVKGVMSVFKRIFKRN